MPDGVVHVLFPCMFLLTNYNQGNQEDRDKKLSPKALKMKIETAS
jgi:hypothetical protein